MFSPRWKKLLRDLQAARGRMVMMTLAIAVSIFGVGTILSGYTILTREVSRNYLGTNPASAFIEMDRVDDSVVEAVRRQPGIAEAEAGSWLTARLETSPNEWMPILLFVVRDFNAMRLSTFQSESGAWPPPEKTILLEREALPLVQAKVGDVLSVQTPNGEKQEIVISGIVHDPALAPAWQEQMAYGYISPATLAWLGESDTLHILKVAVEGQPNDVAAVEATISDLAAWLKGQGYTVEEIRIPPPGKHPHQSQMTSVLMTLLAFSLMALVLSAILTATMIGGLLAQQIRQIGIMKAIGARTRQITSLYLVLIVLIGVAAVAIGVPPGIVAGRGFARVVAQLLNLTLYSEAVPAWVYGVQLLMGILVPLLVTLYPLLRAAQTTVRETLNDYGTSREMFGSRGLDAWLSQIRGVDNTLILALRNTFRRRGRLLLTLGLLSAAGGMFLTAINVKTGWEQYLAEAASDRHYDLDVRFNRPQAEAKIASIITGVSSVRQVESWNLAPIAVYRPNGLNIVRTYPDGGHGSLTLRSAPPETNLIGLPLLIGRWLRADDVDAVVLNQNAKALFPQAEVGDSIQLAAEGNPSTFRLVGVVKQILSPATAYATPNGFVTATGVSPQSTNAVRVVVDQHDANTIQVVTREIERKLAAENVSVKVIITETMLEEATGGHVYVFIAALMLMSAVMAVVGALGLMSSMGTSVIERTREFGIMRTIGARSSIVLRNVISEGVLIGLMSWVFAIVLSIPLSLGVGYLIGNMAFRAPLPLIVPPSGVALWLLTIVIGSMAASAYPAWQASQLTIRETLVYV